MKKMTMGRFREVTEELPDETEIVIDYPSGTIETFRYIPDKNLLVLELE